MQLKKVQRKIESAEEVEVLEITEEEFTEVYRDVVRELMELDKKKSEGHENSSMFRLLCSLNYAQLSVALIERLFEEEE